MKRALVWLQLIVGWLPVWMMYATMIAAAHPLVSFENAAFISLRAIACAAMLGVGVYRLTDRVPWPYPLTPRFIALHALAALVYATAWVLLTSLVEVLLHTDFHGAGMIVIRLPWMRYFVMGVWLYIMVTGVAYAISAAERTAKAEAAAARSQLAALRSQLNPHFLFNALHTVVQLIPQEPKLAAEAAEQLAGLLRTTLEEDRDLVSLDDEWRFVERYLQVERIRFGKRLQVRAEIAAPARTAMLPAFALQTLVENAVRHGVEPKVAPTTIIVSADLGDGALTVRVRDDGAGATSVVPSRRSGTGLDRLRERLLAHYRGAARLDAGPGPAGGYVAVLVVPQGADAA